MEEIKEVYNNIASEFDASRIRVWPHVANFLSDFNNDNILLDVGCGNGKNMLHRPELNFKGIDISNNLVNICQHKNLDVNEGCITDIKFNDNTFDGIICIAVYHHLSNNNDRKKALDELYRVLKPNGKLLITVWAMEQPIGSKFDFKQTNEMIKWTSVKTNKIYYRYYHIYRKDELINEILELNQKFLIINQGYENGNWFIILSK